MARVENPRRRDDTKYKLCYAHIFLVCDGRPLAQRKTKRGRRSAGGLRKHQHVDNVVVEESFALHGSSQDRAGEGVYISATTSNNKRYYGILVDQPALKEASTMWFQDQADSLELNKRMKVLMGKKEENRSKDEENRRLADETKQPAEQEATTNEPASESRAPAVAFANTSESATPPPASATVNNAAGGVSASGESQLTKRPLEASEDNENGKKRLRQEEAPASVSTDMSVSKPKDSSEEDRPVQKFKYVVEKPSVVGRREAVKDPGYRILVATFCSVEEAAGGDDAKTEAIQAACEEGGNFLPNDDRYYYQYEVLPTALSSSESSKNMEFEMRTSMGFNSFLQNTLLPSWFPLSNLQLGQHKVLSMLSMKRDNNGNVVWDSNPAVPVSSNTAAIGGGTQLPMHPRPKKQYQIGVIGGGIAGLACCQELVTALQNDGIDAQVTVLEARSRFGGRLWTDRTLLSENNEAFPIELGASWIHGIDDNPLAALAKQANIDFVTASEEVQMLGKDIKRVDRKMDEAMGKLFDDLLDRAADDCWGVPDITTDTRLVNGRDPQAGVRWYSSVFVERGQNEETEGAKNGSDKNAGTSKSADLPMPKGAPPHRRSSDKSIDFEIGKAISEHKFREFSKLSNDEHRMLLWNTKNIEYALGANISDLSMKYWDADERHAFEGDHVLLKQGFSAVIEYMLASLEKAGSDRFNYVLDFPVGKVEYARKSATQAYRRDRLGRERKLVELSDTCSVTSQDGTQTKYFDFLVCTAPLGVLKESVQRAGEQDSSDKLSFSPCLPFSKIDAISNVGFGLLDKVYLRFSKAFWRLPDLLKEDDECLFGNISGLNPHHYMFFDVGKCLGSGENSPAILMSLISGKEAVMCERLSDAELVDEVMTTLRTIFSNLTIPEPVAFRATRWGRDKYSRGSYTFLPPGATDQDFQLLQSPINGNGDSLLLEGSETMRLFFAGEHTTALHPSMAHGAMLSGMRAAKELISTLQYKRRDDKDTDRVIPVALFRHKNPTTQLQCSLCQKVGGQVREGALLAFKRGARQALVHNNCAEYSPEVEVRDSIWKNVIRAVNRGKGLNCSLCKQNGGTIGCTAENCYRVFHCSCAEDTGWRFDRDGKVFFCDLHRRAAPATSNQCDRVSLKYFSMKNPGWSMTCSFCHLPESESVPGKLLAFQAGRRQTCVHENCVKFTTIVDIPEGEDSRMGHEYSGIFTALHQSRTCIKCAQMGATIGCTDNSCNQAFHLHCATLSGWNFEKRGKLFRCEIHRNRTLDTKAGRDEPTQSSNENAPSSLQHNLLTHLGAMPRDSRVEIPSNLDIGGEAPQGSAEADKGGDYENSDTDESFLGEDGVGIEVMDVALSYDVPGTKRIVRVERSSTNEIWNISFKVLRIGDSRDVISVVATTKTNDDVFALQVGDIVVSINGTRIGSAQLKCLRDVMFRLKQEVDLMMEVIRK